MPAEADELILRINSDATKNLEEGHRLRVEKHAQNLKKIKSEVHAKIKKKEDVAINLHGEGMHEAYLDIVKAMGQLKSYISGNRPGGIKGVGQKS